MGILEDMLARTLSDEQTILPEAQIMALNEALGWMQASNPYKIGDLVTTRKNSGMRGHGKPSIVVEVLAEPMRAQGEDGQSYVGDMNDIRIAEISSQGSVVTYLVASWRLEPYTGEGAA
jgi:hypothetical protein